MTTDGLVIDCDGHILEPPDLWKTYLEELRGMVAPMTESGRRGILGEKVARAYRLV